MRSKKPARSAKTGDAKAIGSWTVGLVVCVLAAAALLAARQPSRSTDIGAAQAQATMTAPVVRARASNTAASAPTPVSTPVAASARAAVSAPAVESAAIVPAPTTVTITGCLERDDETFRLKDTAGAEAPQSRSWKSGFLKKRPASMEVIDAANRLNLSNHVGRRVSVSGTRVDREMRARSLRRIAESC